MRKDFKWGGVVNNLCVLPGKAKQNLTSLTTSVLLENRNETFI